MNLKLVYGKYRRKSEDSEDKQVASLESQQRELNEVKEKLGLRTKDYLPESRSAHTPGRPIFNQLLDEIEQGVVNAILVYHANRLSRNAFDTGRLIYLMDQGKLLEIRTPARTYKDTPDDKFMLGLEFGMSKKDSDDKGLVVKRGLKNKLLMGWRPGNAPQGYLNDKTEEIGARTIMIDPERFTFIQKIFELKLNGMPVRKIQALTEKEWGFRTKRHKRMGGKPLSMSLIYNILTNPFYAGKYEFPLNSGNWYEGKHKPAVSLEVFEKIQRMLGNNAFKTKANYKIFSYTGLLQCGECQGFITAEEKHRVVCSVCKNKIIITVKNSTKCPKCKTLTQDMDHPKFYDYIYYHCTKSKNHNCSQKSIQIEELEKQISEQIDGIEINDTFMEWAIEEINKENDQTQKFQVDKLESLHRAHKDCHQQLTNLLNLKISPNNTDGHMLSDDRFASENARLEKELAELDEKITKFNQQVIEQNKETADKFNFAATAKQKFENGDLEDKRKILSELGSNFILMDKQLKIELPEIFNKIKQMKAVEPLSGSLIGTPEESFTAAQLREKYSNNQDLLRDMDSDHDKQIQSLLSYH